MGYSSIAPNINIQGKYSNGNLIITNEADFEAQLARNAAMDFRNKSGWETAKNATELTDMEAGFIEDYLQPGSRSAQMIEGGSEIKMISKSFGTIAGFSLGIVNVGLTVKEGIDNPNGWQTHNTADVLVSTAEAGFAVFEATSPIGWAFGIGMFVGNIISEHYTGKSITENLFDNNNS